MKRKEFDRPQQSRPEDGHPAGTLPIQPSGIKVRSGVRSGAWNCTSCQGEILGDQLFRPTCSFCQAT